MSNYKIKYAALALLKKSLAPEEATKGFSAEELHELEYLMKSINKKTGDGRYGRPNPDIKVKEVMKTDSQGQWKIEKAIKPGPTLDYSKFNEKPDYADIEAKAPTINYQNNSATKKPTWTGAADKATAVRTKIDTESKETAAETIARRQKGVKGVVKSDGVNVEPELTANQQKRMVVKNEMMGYGQEAGGAANVMQSEEPHKDDPQHEAKEKKKAKKIKKEAEDLLDMNKKEKDTTGLDGILEKAKFITPEQQKANKVKATSNANNDAMREKHSTSKEWPKHWENAKTHLIAARKDPNHRFHHLTSGITTKSGDIDPDKASESLSRIATHLANEDAAGKTLPVSESKHLSVVRKT
jgi:hypothetical protein